LTVLKGVEWTDLPSATISCLRMLVQYLIIATQTPSPLLILSSAQVDTEAIKEVFEKARVNGELMTGLKYIMSHMRVLTRETVGEQGANLVKRGLEVAREVLQRAV